MKLKDYIRLCQEVNGEIVAFNYSFNGDTNEDNDIEDFSIGSDILRLEDLKFDANVEGDIVDGMFKFRHETDTIGIVAMH